MSTDVELNERKEAAAYLHKTIDAHVENLTHRFAEAGHKDPEEVVRSLTVRLRGNLDELDETFFFAQAEDVDAQDGEVEPIPAVFAEIYATADDVLQAPIYSADYLRDVEAQAVSSLQRLLKDQPHILALCQQVGQLRTLSAQVEGGTVQAQVNKQLIACVLDVVGLSQTFAPAGV